MNQARPQDIVKYIDESTSSLMGNYSVVSLKHKAEYYSNIGIELMELPVLYEIDSDDFYEFCNITNLHSV